MAKKISGPGRLGSATAVKKSAKGGGDSKIKNIRAEDSLTVRFLDEPEDWFGYYEHWLDAGPVPCTTDECPGCDSDDDDEKRRSFKYLANAYVVDDQKVWALKMPKTLVEMLMNFYEKYKGTLLDRDYELTRTGSGQFDTKYMAAPDDKNPMKLSRFDKKKFDLEELLSELAEEDEEVKPKRSSRPSKSKEDIYDDEDDEDYDDDEDDDDEVEERPKKKKKSAVKARRVRR